MWVCLVSRVLTWLVLLLHTSPGHNQLVPLLGWTMVLLLEQLHQLPQLPQLLPARHTNSRKKLLWLSVFTARQQELLIQSKCNTESHTPGNNWCCEPVNALPQQFLLWATWTLTTDNHSDLYLKKVLINLSTRKFSLVWKVIAESMSSDTLAALSGLLIIDSIHKFLKHSMNFKCFSSILILKFII